MSINRFLQISISISLLAVLTLAVFPMPAVASANGLAGYWSFDEGSGFTAADSSENGNDGALKGGAAWKPGKYGEALEFDGDKDYVEAPDADALDFGDGDFSASAWVFVNSFTDAILFGKYGTSGSGWRVESDPNGRLVFYADGETRRTSQPVILRSSYQHIAVVRAGDGVSFYVDGEFTDSTDAISANLDNDTSFTVATTVRPPVNVCCQRYFKGHVDEVRLYNTALTADQIEKVYNNEEIVFDQEAEQSTPPGEEEEPSAPPPSPPSSPSSPESPTASTPDYPDGTLALDISDNRTIYIIAGGKKRGFASAEAFLGFGYRFDQARPLDISGYETGLPILTAQGAHPEGAVALDKSDTRTVYWILEGRRRPFESAEIFFSHGFTFDQIVPANDDDMALPEGEPVAIK